MPFVYRFHHFLIKFVSLVMKKKAYRRYYYYLFWRAGFCVCGDMDY